MVDLSPCPFCNGKVKHHLAKIQHCQLHGEPYQDYLVYCTMSTDSGYGVGYDASHARVRASTKEEAFKIWNRTK